MTKSLKEILVKIACLSKADQCWILRQLPESQKAFFNQKQGKQLLQEARRFRKLAAQTSYLAATPSLLPFDSQALANCPALFTAIILEQGKFSWEKEFLKDFDPQAAIQGARNYSLPLLKEAAKQALFQQWQANRSHQKLAEKSESRDGLGDRSEIFAAVHEDSCTASTKQVSCSLEYPKKSNLSFDTYLELHHD